MELINAIGGHDGGLPALHVVPYRLTLVCAEFDFFPKIIDLPCCLRGRLPERSAAFLAVAQRDFGEPTDEDGGIIFQHACPHGSRGHRLEAAERAHRSGPSKDWVKVKNPDSPAMIRARETEW
jgi:hypothetical protein